jgi:surface polysaccharide O-acyltransferase-like enzyme
VAFLAGYAVTVLGTWWLSQQKGSLDETFYSSLSLNVIVMSIAAYILLRELGVALARRERVARWIRSASALGLGAYLVHALVLELLARGSFGVILDGRAMHPAFAIPLTALVAFSLSLVLCSGLRRVPVVRILVP